MVRAIRQQQPDAVFHLGDCERDTQRLEKEFPDLPLYRVCGNCDREPVNPEVLQLTLDGVKFFLTHGHRYSVKYTLDALFCGRGYGALRAHAPCHERDHAGAVRRQPRHGGRWSALHVRLHRDGKRRDPYRRHPRHSGSKKHKIYAPGSRRGRILCRVYFSRNVT